MHYHVLVTLFESHIKLATDIGGALRVLEKHSVRKSVGAFVTRVFTTKSALRACVGVKIRASKCTQAQFS